MCDSADDGRVFSLAAAVFEPAEMGRLAELASRPISPGQTDHAAKDCINIILARREYRNEADPLNARLKIRNIGNNTRTQEDST
jgi:hypothetical protein